MTISDMLATFMLTLSIVALCVVVHYELLNRLGTFIDSQGVRPRQAVLFGVMLALAAHIIEIYIFAGGYYYVLQHPDIGTFTGDATMEDFSEEPSKPVRNAARASLLRRDVTRGVVPVGVDAGGAAGQSTSAERANAQPRAGLVSTCSYCTCSVMPALCALFQ